MFSEVMSSVYMVHLLFAALVTSVLGVELSESVMFPTFVEVVVELVFLVEFIFMVLVVETWSCEMEKTMD